MSIFLTENTKAQTDTAYQATAWKVVEATTATTDLDLSIARNFRVIMLANTTLNFTNPPPDKSLYDVNIRFQQYGAANYQVSGYTVNGGAFTHIGGDNDTGRSGAVSLEEGTAANTFMRAELRYLAADSGSYTPAGQFLQIYRHWNWNRMDTATATATTVNLDLAGARQFDLTLATAAVTVNLINLPVDGEQYQFALRVRQDGSGSRTIGGWRVETATATPNYVDGSTFALNSSALAVTEITGRVANISGSYSVFLGKTDGPGGAGGLSYFAEARGTAAPNATVPAHSFTATGAETNIDAVIVPKGTGALTTAIPDATATGGNKRGQYSNDAQRKRAAAAQVASGYISTISGGENNTASASWSFVGGGYGNTASDGYSVCVGGESNSASGTGGGRAFIGGGSTNTASLAYAMILGGYGNTASENHAVCIGELCTADGSHSITSGLRASARGLYGRMSFASGYFSVLGDAQIGDMVLRRQTTDATVTTLTSNNSAVSSSNIPILPNNSAYTVVIHLTARQNTTGDAKSWKIESLYRRGANAAATVQVAETVTVIGGDAGAAAWTVATAADTTNGGISVNVTGEAAKTIRWVAKVSTVEVAG